MDLAKLKELALAATPGPWWADAHKEWHQPQTQVHDEGTGETVTFYNSRPEYDKFMFCGTRGKAEREWANAEFIAAANPAAVLELIALVERPEVELAAARVPAASQSAHAAFEAAYPAAIRARRGDEYGGGFGSMFVVWQAAVASCAPAVAEQVDALTDERAAFDSAFLSANGFHTKAELEEEWLKGLSGVMFRAGAVIAATRQAGPVQHETDLLDIVRSLLSAVDRKAEAGDNYPSPTAESRPWMIAARLACVERGYTAGGLSVDGKAPTLQPMAAALHYPDCWDVATYPTLESALAEVYAWFKCSEHEAAPVQAEPEGAERIRVLEEALKFYADGEHFTMHDSDAWDTVSGEPPNFYEDESNTATVEDGSVAKMALAGTPVAYTDDVAPAPVSAK